MARFRVLALALVIGALFYLVAPTVEPPAQAQNNGKGKGNQAPEVPMAALLPLASAGVGGAYYVVNRVRYRRRRDETHLPGDRE